MKILFHENQLSYRGTSVSLFDYAHYNETILGNQSLITYNSRNVNNNSDAIKRFDKRFKVIPYETIEELNEIVKTESIDIFYAIKSGENDGIIVDKIKNCIHVVFKVYEPHGEVYAYVSEWLAENITTTKKDFVPHIISVEKSTDTLHEMLNISSNCKVFGYYGGNDSFNIKFVKKVVRKIAKSNPNIYFIFMGIDNFLEKRFFWQTKINYKNIIFLESSTDPLFKSKFINTCDGMLHARLRGETFGIAIGEFALKDKPIITFKESFEKNHYKILGDDAYYYKNSAELTNILLNSELVKSARVKYLQFSPELVMKKFKQIFID